MPQLSQRVELFTDSVIRRMTRISEQYGAINLSQGYPDFDPPKPMLDRLAQVAYEGSPPPSTLSPSAPRICGRPLADKPREGHRPEGGPQPERCWSPAAAPRL